MTTSNLIKNDHVIYLYNINELQMALTNNFLQNILQRLHLKAIDELITGDYFNIQNISKSVSLHPLIIQSELHAIQQMLTITPSFQKTETIIQFDKIFNKWIVPGKCGMDKIETNLTIQTGDTIQILGRVNSGKTYLLHELIIECLKNQISVFYLDGCNGLKSLKHKIQLVLKQSPNIRPQSFKLHHFQFRSHYQLVMLIHCLGNFIGNKSEQKVYFFIDTLNRSQQQQLQSVQSISALQFKSAQKIKKLFHQLSLKVGAIIYTSKIMNSNGLFDTIYKHEKHRPKGVGSSAKQWDNLSNKTITLDFTQTKQGQDNWWIHSTKGLESSIYKLIRNL